MSVNNFIRAIIDSKNPDYDFIVLTKFITISCPHKTIIWEFSTQKPNGELLDCNAYILIFYKYSFFTAIKINVIKSCILLQYLASSRNCLHVLSLVVAASNRIPTVVLQDALTIASTKFKINLHIINKIITEEYYLRRPLSPEDCLLRFQY